MKETLYIYTRVSSKVQEEGTSLDEQKKVGLKISKEEGLKPKVLNEGGKSSNFEDCLNRPKLQDISTFTPGIPTGSLGLIHFGIHSKMSLLKMGLHFILKTGSMLLILLKNN